MTEQKTRPNDQSVEAFLNGVEDEKKRQDSFALLKLFSEATGEAPRMWGDSIVGFGEYHYRYASGREGDSPLTGFSPRKQALTLYIMAGFEQYSALLSRLGKFKTGKACLYVKKLEDIDLTALKELVKLSAEHIARANT
jgi:hypothetical protein